jgi:flagellar biosynthesis protein FlhG
MKDQAERLRILAKKIKEQVEVNSDNKGETEALDGKPIKKTRVITVTSGKGGVGKTNFTINLALALASYGKKVMIMDADLGLANVDVALGISPQFNLYHVLKGEKTIKDIITPGPNGILVVAGGSGIQELANLPKRQVDRFVRQLGDLEGMADILLIDTGAGLSRNVMSFVLAAEEVIVVTTPEPTAITDAYGLIKTLTTRKKNGLVRLVVNKVESNQEADVASGKLTAVADRFLKFRVDTLGYIYDDSSVSKAVKNQKAFLLMFPNSSASKCILSIAAKLTDQEPKDDSNGIKGFFSKIVQMFN